MKGWEDDHDYLFIYCPRCTLRQGTPTLPYSYLESPPPKLAMRAVKPHQCIPTILHAYPVSPLPQWRTRSRRCER